MDIHPLEIRQNAAQFTYFEFHNKMFGWGTYDCAKMASYVIEMSGQENPMKDFAPYKSYRGALRAMANKSLPDWLESLGHPEIPLTRAMVGDIVSIPADTGGMNDSLAVNMGQGNVLAFWGMDNGMSLCVKAPIKAATKAWSLFKSPALVPVADAQAAVGNAGVDVEAEA
jgi:hypothetical protein